MPYYKSNNSYSSSNKCISFMAMAASEGRVSEHMSAVVCHHVQGRLQQAVGVNEAVAHV